MGFKVAWIAVRGKPIERVLEDLALERTGEFEEFPEGEYAIVTMADGVVVVVNNFTMGDFILAEPLDRVKRDADIVTCYVNESTMMSQIEGFWNGEELWSVTHDCENGIDHLEVTGEPPAPFVAIRDNLREQQASTSEKVDYLFDVAAALGEALCGYRHDKDVEGMGEKPFEILEPSRVAAAAAKRPWWTIRR